MLIPRLGAIADRVRWSLAALVLVASVPSTAAPVAIDNASFETDTLPAGGAIPDNTYRFDSGFPSDWTAYDPNALLDGGSNAIGVVNPTNSTFFPGGPTDGSLAAIVFVSSTGIGEVGIEQALADTLAANTTYTLTVNVGNPASGTGSASSTGGAFFLDLTGFPGYRIELLAGGVRLVSDSGAIVADGAWATRSLEFTTGDAPPQLGTPLAIRLVSLNQSVLPDPGLEVAFDDVRLTAVAVPAAVPLLGVWGRGLVLAGLVLGACFAGGSAAAARLGKSR